VSEFDLADDSAIDARLRRHGDALRAERNGCPHPELLFARRSEVLDADVRGRLDAHVSTCAACRRLAEDVEKLDLAKVDAAVEQRVLTRVTGPARQGRGGLLSLAASLLLASGLAVTWWYARTGAPANVPPTASQTPAAPQVPAPVVALWTVRAAPVRVPLSSLGVPRGSETSPAPDGAVLVTALAPYQKGDYVDAIARLSPVVRDFPESGEAHFYLGVSHLMAGHPAEAVESFVRAYPRLPAARQVEAEWYRATAEQRAGLTDRARKRLRAVCERPGEYQAQACAAERSLK
jgi:TolA-binding protein